MPRITAKFVAGVTEPGRYHDGDAGLFLAVQEHKGRIRKSYVQRLTVLGKRVDIGLGSVKWTTPSEARAAAQAHRKVARQGGDPRAKRRAVVPTFEAAADIVIRLHAETWRDGGKSEKQWRSSLATYAFPRIGQRSVATIATSDVLGVLMPIWNAKRTTASRVCQRIGAVMKWAIAEGHRADNPAGEAIGAALPKSGPSKAHHKALPYDRMSDALRRVRELGCNRIAALAFEFMVLVAARSGELRGARWREVDLEAETWTVPAERMKTRRTHRVPLSARALEVLREARALSGGEGLVFPSAAATPLADSTLSKLCKELDLGMVPHGARSSFREWAAERTNIPREVTEEALSHVNPNRDEAAYQRSDLFDRRRVLMDSWATYLDAESATVVAIR